jgi:hypothetical protein
MGDALEPWPLPPVPLVGGEAATPTIVRPSSLLCALAEGRGEIEGRSSRPFVLLFLVSGMHVACTSVRPLAQIYRSA